MSEGIDRVERRSRLEKASAENLKAYQDLFQRKHGYRPLVIADADRGALSPLGKGNGQGLSGDFRGHFRNGHKLP
jgi:hypothetical protein